jgi:hypothetical protein
MSGLNFIEKWLQKKVVEQDKPGLPVHKRVYIDSVGRDNSTPLTEKDLTPDELDSLRQTVRTASADYATPKGRVGYNQYAGSNNKAIGTSSDYDKSTADSLKGTLGNFGYETREDNTVHATDTYKFGPYGAFGGRMTAIGAALQGVGGLARYLGEAVRPPGKGRKVDINLGPKVGAGASGKW